MIDWSFLYVPTYSHEAVPADAGCLLHRARNLLSMRVYAGVFACECVRVFVSACECSSVCLNV